jgi:probable LLM family oxidoreductase
MESSLEFGLNTFGDVTVGADGKLLSHAQVIRDVVQEAVVADELGIDFFGIGEHHRVDFAVSSPEVVLGTIGGKTNRIRLGSAVTVLSTDDPVRVFQRFATLEAATNGRMEVILGRGWFTEPFRLFGYQVADYDTLFEEKLGLFATLIRQNKVTWQGKTRAPLTNQTVFPAIESGSLKTWMAVGATPKSVLQAARYDLPLMLAIIGGEPLRFAPFVELYRRAFEKYGRPVRAIGVHSVGYIAETDARARDEFWPYYQKMRDRLGSERGWPPIKRTQLDLEADKGSLYVGSPECVARKIVDLVRNLKISRFVMKYSVGQMPHTQLLRSIELYGTRVCPLVLDMLGGKI